MRKWIWWGGGVLVGLAALGAILNAASGDDNSEELEAQVVAVGEERDTFAADLTETRDDLRAAESELETERQIVDDLESQVAALEDALGAAEAARTAAEAEAEELRLTYDPQIRAGLQAEVDAEIGRACAEARERYETSVSQIVKWDDDWSPVTTEEAVESAVEECAAPIRNQSAAEREAARLASCEMIEVDQVEKNPAAYDGTCVVTYARIVQFDAATGPCSFHAELSSRRSTRWYDYDVRSTFGYADTELLSTIETDCPQLADIDGDDYIKVWATGLGSYSYDTSIGGSNTVPSFRIEKVELVRKD